MTSPLVNRSHARAHVKPITNGDVMIRHRRGMVGIDIACAGNSTDKIELIRPPRGLASKAQHLIPAEEWPLGLAARIIHSLAPIRRTNTAGRSSTHQRRSNGLHSDHQSTSLLSVGTNIIDLMRLFVFVGRISRHWEEHGKIDRPFREGLHARAILLVPTLEVRKTRARTARRFGRSTVGETYEPRAMLGIEGQNTGSGVVVGAELDRSRISRHPSPI
jgi:hypothetical protein